MKQLLLLFVIVMSVLVVNGQTNPSPQSLPYAQNFSSLTGTTPVYPAGFQGWTVTGSLGTSYSTSAPNGDQAIVVTTNASTSGHVGDFVGKMGMLSTGSAIKAICLSINTTNNISIVVSFDAATQRTENTRLDELGLQYRIGTTGAFTNVAGSTYQNQKTPTNTTGTVSVNIVNVSVTLPIDANNAPVVQLRWIIRDVSGSGNRPGFSIDNVSVTGTSYPLDPTSVTATPASSSQIDIAYTPYSGNNVIIAYNSVNSFGTPVEGNTYAANDPITGGGTVLYNGLTSPFSHTALSANTQYYYKVWSVNGSNLYSPGIEVNASTLKNAPTTQASLLNFPAASVGNTSLLVKWTNGDGDKRVVIANTTNTFTAPVNGTDPSANSVYTSGQQVVYNGPGSDFTVTGLVSNTAYWFKVYEYNNPGANTLYCPGTGIDNPLSQVTSPTPTPPLVESPTYASITNNSAILGGKVTSAGNVVGGLLERGTVWNTSGSVTIADNKAVESSPITGVFTHLRTGMPPKTQIYFKAYATNILGTTLTTDEGTFFTLADEPSAYPGSFTATPTGSFSINLTWTAATGADGYLIILKAGSIAPTGVPNDATGYSLSAAIGDGTLVADVLSGTTISQSITGLVALSQYSFIIVPYAYDALNYQTYNYKTNGTIPTATTTTLPPTYTWVGATGGDWTLASNWSPARSVKTSNDILLFNSGSTLTVTKVPSETVAQLYISNNTAVTLQATSANTLVFGGFTTDDASIKDLTVSSGAQLTLAGSGAITLNVPVGAFARISGAITFTGGAHRVSANATSPFTFASGSSFTAGTGFSGNPFGATPLNSVVFESGSYYIQVSGGNPFGASSPNSVVNFQAGSTYRLDVASAPATSGRTYPNFEYNNSGNVTITGSSAASFDNFTVTQGTFNFNMTGVPGHSIKGNISVASGATLNFSPSGTGTVNLNGSGPQTITGPGTISISANSTLDINNSNGLTINTPVTVNGKINLTNGLITLGNNDLLLTSTGSITGVPSSSKMIVATGTGQLRKEFTTGFTGSFVFPVGDNTGTPEYSPVTLNFTGGTFGSGNYVGVNLVNSQYPGDLNTGSYLKRYWTITQNAITGFTCDATFQFDVADVTGNENEIYSIKIAPTPVVMFGLANTTLHQLTAPGLTSFSTFAGTQTDPLPYTVSGDGSYCQNTGGLTVTLSNSQPGVSYQLKKNNVNEGTAITGTGSALTWTGQLAGTYTVVGYNTVATVPMTESAVITEIPSAPVSVSIAPDANNICAGTSVIVTATPVNGGTASYSWYKNTVAVGLNQNTYTFTPINGDQVYVVLTSDATCAINTPATSSTLTMNVIPLPVPVITGPASICKGSTGVTYSTATGKTNYVWTISAGGTITAGAGTRTITVTWNTAGDQSVSVNYTDNTCNAATATVYNVTVNPLPVVTSPSLYPDIHLEDPIPTLTGGLPEGGTYSGQGIVNGTFNPTLVGNGSFAITYTYTDVLGCSNFAIGYIHVLDPGTFSYTVGTGGSFENLTGTNGAFDYLNNNIRYGNIELFVVSDLTEPGTVALNEGTEVLPGGYTISIRPNDVAEKVISGNVDQAMIRLDGADRVIFNGSISFPTKSLRFNNTNPAQPTLLLINGANYNNFTGCIFEGSNSIGNSGVVMIGSTTSTGNSNNSFSSNQFTNDDNAALLPANLFYSEGNSSNTNTNNTLSNNEFANFNQSGVFVHSTGNGNIWIITGNSFYYNLVSPATTSQTAINFIPGSSSSNNSIINNYIGGSGYQTYGSQWVNCGNIIFKGISVSSSSCTISHNTISNIKLTSSLTPGFTGIEILSGTATVNQANIIGSLNIINSIQLAGTGIFNGIKSTSTSKVTINGDKIANISTTAATGSPTLNCLYLQSGTISNNLIYNIGSATNYQTPIIYGIINTGYLLATNNFSNNMISLKGGNSSNPRIYGIYDQSTSTSLGNNYQSNTVSISGTPIASTTNSTYAFYRQGNGTITLYNNILSNQRSSLTLSKSYAIYSLTTTNWTSNYNDLKTISPTLGYWNSTLRIDLAAWKSATGKDAYSVSVTPVFVSATDLHLTAANTGIFDKGNITYAPALDYDNQTRSLSAPDLGADEYFGVKLKLNAIAQEVNPVTAEMQIYPNPSADIANIVIQLPEASLATILVYNTTGILVAKFDNKELQEGPNSFSLNCMEFTPGIYFVRLIVPGQPALVHRLEIIH